ncbi:hypothetical protein NDU88_000557 [Pleurodeles waltl]|uniref:Uncharacterized protein n=1 Tax=Pleurodeles waltl TaxID=8319 RepID=A0AAV7P1D5_PLEWA|nr:hypothetical protein NDU88_000557 [Pleurodeles waltl]
MAVLVSALWRFGGLAVGLLTGALALAARYEVFWFGAGGSYLGSGGLGECAGVVTLGTLGFGVFWEGLMVVRAVSVLIYCAGCRHGAGYFPCRLA